MHRSADGSLRLSPSDLTAYLACPHLTTLSLEVALGERKRPYTREALAELVAQKGDLHEARYLEFLREQGREVVEIELAARVRRVRGGTRRDRRRDARRRGGRSTRRRSRATAGAAGPTSSFASTSRPTSARGATSRTTRSSRAAAKPAAVLQLAWYADEIAAIQGRLPERLHVVLGTSEVETYRPADVDAYLRDGAAAPAARTSRSGRRRIRGRATTARAATSSRSAAQRWEDDDHLTRVASIRRDQIGKLETVDVTTLTGLAESPADLRVRRLAPAMLERLRDQAALQLHRYRTGELTYHLLAAAGAARARAAAGALAGRRVLRHGGRPVLRPGLRGSSSCSACSGASRTGRRPIEPFWAYDRDGEQARVRAVRRLRHRAPARVPGHARLPLRRLRALDAGAADGRARDARGGDRRAAARRGARRPAAGRAAGPARRGRVVLAEGHREAVLHAQGRGQLGQRGGDRVRALARRPRPGAPRRHRRLQRGGLPRDARAARLAARAPARGRARARRRDPVPAAARARRVPVETDDAPDETARLRDALLASADEGDGRAAARRGCSSTTSARRARPGGGTSAGAR